MFGVVDETTTTKFASRACAVHCISLVVVDKVVVVVLKFPTVCSSTTAAINLPFGRPEAALLKRG